MIKRKITFLLCVFILLPNIVVSLNQNQERVEKRKEFASLSHNRWHWQQPSKIMDIIELKPGMVVADVGAGYGYFTLGMAKLVGEKGRVYANEIDEHCLRIIEQDCKDEKINNVITVLGEEKDPRLPKGEMDIVLMVNVLHYFDENEGRVTFLKNIIPSLKQKGALVIVQWKRDRTAGTRSPSVYEENIRQSGYEISRIETFLPQQIIFICHPDTKGQNH